MSRNKIIKRLHLVSGRSYKECRDTLKITGWDYNAAVVILFPNAFEILQNAVERVSETLTNWSNVLADFCITIGEVAERVLQERFGGIDVSDLSSGYTAQPENEEEQSADRISEWQAEADTV